MWVARELENREEEQMAEYYDNISSALNSVKSSNTQSEDGGVYKGCYFQILLPPFSVDELKA